MESFDVPVLVALRVRPLLQKEIVRNASNIIKRTSTDPKVVIAQERGFAFDHVFINDDQETVYNDLMKPIVEKFLFGYNCTVLAYGHTGTGKTYTMGINAEAYGTDNSGLVTRAMENIFQLNSSNPDVEFAISFLEVYNKEVYDVLVEPPVKLDVRKGAQVNKRKVPVETLEVVADLLVGGMCNRHTRPTVLNDNSSRSHAILTIYRTHTNSMDQQIISKLNLVDLAGSEGVRNTGNEGEARQEGININQGLLVLRDILQKLSVNSKDFISYRNSVLTSILHDCLQSKNIIALIACVSPSNEHVFETMNTLRFAEDAKKVKCRAEIGRVVKQFKTVKTPSSGKKKLLSKTPASRSLHKSHPYMTPFRSRKMLASSSKSVSKRYGTRTPRLPLKDINDTSIISNFSSNTMNISSSTSIASSSMSPEARNLYEKYKEEMDERITTVVREQLRRPSIAAWSCVSLESQDRSDSTNTGKPQLDTSGDEWKKFKDDMKIFIEDTIHRERRRWMTNSLMNVNSDTDDVKCRLAFEEESPPVQERTVISTGRYRTRLSVRSEDAQEGGKTPRGPTSSSYECPTPSLHQYSTRLSTQRGFSVKGDSKCATPQAVSSLLVVNTHTPCTPLYSSSSYPSPVVHQTVRRSARISRKLSVCAHSKETSTRIEDSSPDRSNQENINLPYTVRRTTRPSKPVKRQDSPVTVVKKKAIGKKKVQSKYSDIQEEHNNWVLSVLNSENASNLEKLPTVGPKTALIIFNYRRLHMKGQFVSIQDLKNIPGLQKNYFNRFALANNVFF